MWEVVSMTSTSLPPMSFLSMQPHQCSFHLFRIWILVRSSHSPIPQKRDSSLHGTKQLPILNSEYDHSTPLGETSLNLQRANSFNLFFLLFFFSGSPIHQSITLCWCFLFLKIFSNVFVVDKTTQNGA